MRLLTPVCDIKNELLTLFCTIGGMKFWHLKYIKVKGDSLIFYSEFNFSKLKTKNTELVREEGS